MNEENKKVFIPLTLSFVGGLILISIGFGLKYKEAHYAGLMACLIVLFELVWHLYTEVQK